jgi:mRNA-degrading endonuclease RelE of RelBE toxin-antitoxin system
MRNVRFSTEVVKELRRLARDYKHRDAFLAALTKVYQGGYDNATSEATAKIKEALDQEVSK